MSISRLGVYIDAVYRVVDDRDRHQVWTTSECYQFLRFACAVGESFDSLVLFGRQAPRDLATEFSLPRDGSIHHAPLPYYRDLNDVLGVIRAAPGVVKGMWRGLDDVDAVWVFGPYPF